MAEIADAVAGTLADMFPEAVEAAIAEAGPNSTETAASPEAQETVNDIELPDDIEALLNEPDLDELDDPDEVDPEAYQDAEELARELARVKKRAKWLEEQNLAKSRKEWRKEARKFFPYAKVDQIDASSRRSFLRAARDQHEQVKSLVEPIIAQKQKELTAQQEALQVAAREAAASAWGKPITGGVPSPSAPQTTANERLDQSRRRGDLAGSIRALIESGQVD